MTSDWQIATVGLDESPRIDLNRDRRQERRKVYLRSRLYGIIFGVLTVFSASVLTPSTVEGIQMWRTTTKLQKQIKGANKQLAGMQDAATELDAKEEQWRESTALVNQRKAWGDTLAAVTAAVPSNVYLENLRIEADNAAITITGSSDDIVFVNRFASDLKQSAALQNVSITETSRDATSPLAPLQFQMAASPAFLLTGETK